jgi:hypothetical protein
MRGSRGGGQEEGSFEQFHEVFKKKSMILKDSTR